MKMASILGALLALVGVAALILLDPFVYTIDETIYLAMAERMAGAGALSVENGYSDYPLDPLRVAFLREGSAGALYPQYPSGYALIAAPFQALFGTDGLFVLQILAFAACVPLTAALAKALFGASDSAAFRAAAIFALGTFAADYAIAIWPHALSTLFVGVAWLGAARAIRDGDRRMAALAGAAIGLGLTVRADVIVALPVVVAWMLAHPARPRYALVPFLAALTPGIALAIALNFEKFGVLSPIHYGVSAGGISVSSYLILLPGAALFTIGLLILRNRRGLALAANLWAPFAAGLGLAILAFTPILGDIVTASLRGFYVLWVDIQPVDRSLNGFSLFQFSDFFTYNHTLKTAVTQSMPWIPAAAIFAVFGVWSSRGEAARDGLVFCLLAICVWSAPFAPRAWHGGLSNSMRYFLPLMPLLAVMGSEMWGWSKRHADTDSAQQNWPAVSAIFGGGLAIAGLLLVDVDGGVYWGAWLQFKAPVILALLAFATIFVTLLSAPERRRLPAQASLVSLAAAFGFSMISTAGDMERTFAWRGTFEIVREQISDLPEPNLIIAHLAEPLAHNLAAPNKRIAIKWTHPTEDLVTLANAHLAENWRVFVLSPPLSEEILSESADTLTARVYDPSLPYVRELVAVEK